MADEDNIEQIDDLDGIDLSAIGAEPEADESASPDPAANNGGENPAWAPILEAVPEELREALKPKLQEWDKGVQTRFQKIHQEYEPYKQFKEQGLDPTELVRSYQIRQQIDQDPVGFFTRLGDYLRANGLVEQANQADAKANAAAQQQNGEEDDPIARLERQQQELVQRLEAQRQEEYQRQAEEYARQQVQSEYEQVEQKYGKLSETVRRELFQRATIMTNIAEQQGTEPPTLMEAMESLQNFISQVSKARRPAPRVIPAHGGGLPAPQQGIKPEEMTPQQRSQAAQALIDQVLGNNG